MNPLALPQSAVNEWQQALVTSLYALACITVCVTSFCRLVLIDQYTARQVRAAFVLLFGGALIELYAVLVVGDSATLGQLAFAIGIVAVQVVSSKRWEFGVPSEYGLRDL